MSRGRSLGRQDGRVTAALPDRRAELCALVRGSPWFMRALHAARDLGLPDWCIGAGALRNLVWDHLHGYSEPSRLADLDLVYFDPEEPAGAESAHQASLARTCPDLPWEITNQAHVHLWFESCFGHAVPPLQSLQEAVASWPEFATAVGVRLEADDSLAVIAPYELDDLFDMRIRRNPARVSVETFRQRIMSKNYAHRWPQVQIVDAD
jgi:hypothetical protein